MGMDQVFSVPRVSDCFWGFVSRVPCSYWGLMGTPSVPARHQLYYLLYFIVLSHWNECNCHVK